jgi:hypothetical protein
MSNTPPLNPNAQKVSEFLVRVTKQLLNEQGMTLGLTDLPVMNAAKALEKKDCLPILKTTFQRLAAENPVLVDLLLDGASEAVKDRVRRACGMKER